MTEPVWTSDIERTKCRELSIALGRAETGEVPPEMVFGYAVTPALKHALMTPWAAARRASLRLAGISAVIPRGLKAGTSLSWAYLEEDEEPDRWSYATKDGSLTLSFGPYSPQLLSEGPCSGLEPVLRSNLRVDGARSVAFAAATWDLNPAYWDESFARSIELASPIAPPGLAPAWACMLAADDVGEVRFLDVHLGRAARHGEVLEVRLFELDGPLRNRAFEVTVQGGGLVCTGTVMGPPGP